MRTSKVCPECAQPNAISRTTCHSCGARLPMERETIVAIDRHIAAEKEAQRANGIATKWLLERRIITHAMTQPERAAACREWLRTTTRRKYASDLQVREANEIARDALDKAAWDDAAPF